MLQTARSLRPFIGCRDFQLSASFYRDFGFKETVLGPGFSVFEASGLSFYLQDAYVKDWVDNTMLFLEVAELDAFWQQLVALQLPQKYPGVRVLPIKTETWGRECFVHDPAGILWHIGEFNRH